MIGWPLTGHEALLCILPIKLGKKNIQSKFRAEKKNVEQLNLKKRVAKVDVIVPMSPREEAPQRMGRASTQ